MSQQGSEPRPPISPESLSSQSEALIELAYTTAQHAGVMASKSVLAYWPSPTNPNFDPNLSLNITDKTEGVGNFVTAADYVSGKVMHEILTQPEELAECNFRTEESDEPLAANKNGELWWNNDEIDGTNNFAHGNPNFGISIALHDTDNTPLVGVIALPADQTMAVARHGHGAKLVTFEGQDVVDLTRYAHELDRLPADAKLVIGYDIGYVDRAGQLQTYVAPIADQVGALVSYNSSSYTNVQLALGRLDAFFSKTPTIYDIGAAAVLIQEIGGVVTDMNGEPIDWDTPARSYLAARTPEIHERVLRLLHDRVITN